jgi:hypothetical protein
MDDERAAESTSALQLLTPRAISMVFLSIPLKTSTNVTGLPKKK